MCVALANYMRSTDKNVTIGTLPAYKQILFHVDPPIAYENYEVFNPGNYDSIIDLSHVHNNDFEGPFSKHQMFFAVAGISPKDLPDETFVPSFIVQEYSRSKCKVKMEHCGEPGKRVLMAVQSYNASSPRSMGISQFKEVFEEFPEYSFIITSKDPMQCPQFPNLHNWSSNTPSIEDLISVIDIVDYVISVDTGIMHLASCLGKPVLSFWGPTKPEYLAIHYRKMLAVYTGRECSPCWDRGCQENCLKSISPDVISSNFNKLVSGHKDLEFVDLQGGTILRKKYDEN
jgi:hypothetical protein